MLLKTIQDFQLLRQNGISLLRSQLRNDFQEIGYWIKARGFNNFIPLVEKGIKTEGFLSGLEYIEFDPENQSIGINNTIHYIERKRKEKEIELYGYNVLLGLGLLGLAALILYGIYKVVKE